MVLAGERRVCDGCQFALAFAVGVADPRAKRRRWGWCLPRSCCPVCGPRESRPIGGGHALAACGALRLPVGDELAVRVLGLLGELLFARADFLERVCGGATFLAAARGHAGSQFELAQL